jgi:chemotaxis protein methyltransferase CheR
LSIEEQSISGSDLTRLRSLAYDQAGIHLGPDKKTMLELRIRPRLRVLGLNSYSEYCEYLFGRQGQREELVSFLDVVTTNKTDFFREPGHFEFLVKIGLAAMLERTGATRELRLWSAGCSTGEEPYTLAMVLSEYAEAHPELRFSILATDLSTTVLEKAQRGIFRAEVVAPVPIELRRKYFMRSRDRASDQMRAVPELRSLIEFRRLNFMDTDYGIEGKMDALFCRNVIIYFDRPTKEQIIRKLVHVLVPGGYAFFGHSETLNGFDVPLQPLGPALYRKTDG